MRSLLLRGREHVRDEPQVHGGSLLVAVFTHPLGPSLGQPKPIRLSRQAPFHWAPEGTCEQPRPAPGSYALNHRQLKERVRHAHRVHLVHDREQSISMESVPVLKGNLAAKLGGHEVRHVQRYHPGDPSGYPTNIERRHELFTSAPTSLTTAPSCKGSLSHVPSRGPSPFFGAPLHRCFSISAASFARDTTPRMAPTALPSLKKSSVGIDDTR